MTIKIERGNQYINVELTYRVVVAKFEAKIGDFLWPLQLSGKLPVGYGDTIQAAFDDLKEKVL